MCYLRTKNLDISLKVQGQHLVWYLCSSQAGISLEPVDLTAVLSSQNICSLKLYFWLFAFNSWPKKMPEVDDETIHSGQNYTETRSAHDRFPHPEPSSAPSNGILSPEGFPSSAQIG